MQEIPNRELWEKWAEAHHELKQKMVAKRKRLTQAMVGIERRLKTIRGNEQAPLKRALTAQHRLVQLALGQMEPFNLDTNVFKPPTQVLGPTFQLREQEIVLRLLEVEEAQLAMIQEVLAADLKAAVEGQPAPAGANAAWLTVRAQLGRDPEAVSKLERFQEEYPAYAENVRAAVELFNLAQAEADDKEKLEQVKQLKLPNLKGQGFRLIAYLRQLPGGEAWWESTRVASPLDEAAAVEAAPEPAGKGRGLSRLVKGLLKPTERT